MEKFEIVSSGSYFLSVFNSWTFCFVSLSMLSDVLEKKKFISVLNVLNFLPGEPLLGRPPLQQCNHPPACTSLSFSPPRLVT